MTSKLNITDQRMLQVMNFCIANKLNDITSQNAWCEKVGVSHTNIFNIRKGTQRFTVDHVFNACQQFNISPDFMFGFSMEMLRTDKNRSPLDRIKDAVRELETQQKTTKSIELKPKKKTG